MKKMIIIATLILSVLSIKAQDTIVGWTFPTGTNADAHPDKGIHADSILTITTRGGTSVIDFSKFGNTTYSAKATGWDNGANVKYWQVEINTSGYHTLKLSSEQTSGGTYPGPRDFKVQYTLDTSAAWTDIPNTTIVTANNWTSGVINDVNIPSACDDRSSVYIRWIMTSDTSSAPPTLVQNTGVSKIDDILITGIYSGVGIAEINLIGKVNIYPNPNDGTFTISLNGNNSTFEYVEITITDIIGNKISEANLKLQNNIAIFDANLSNGIYLVSVKDMNGNNYNPKKITVIK